MVDDAEFSDDPLQAYLAALRRVPTLGRDEEAACIQHVRVGDETAGAAKRRLVETNLHLVVILAERHRSERLDILDLIEKGNEGLQRAVQTLTDCPPDSFAAHATKLIERALADGAMSPPPTLTFPHLR